MLRIIILRFIVGADAVLRTRTDIHRQFACSGGNFVKRRIRSLLVNILHLEFGFNPSVIESEGVLSERYCWSIGK